MSVVIVGALAESRILYIRIPTIYKYTALAAAAAESVDRNTPRIQPEQAVKNDYGT